MFKIQFGHYLKRKIRKSLRIATKCITFAPHLSPDGGIGRRAGLKHQWGNPCRFDPGSGYRKERSLLLSFFCCLPLITHILLTPVDELILCDTFMSTRRQKIA